MPTGSALLDSAELRPLTGRLEEQLLTIALADLSVPRRVTELLAAAVHSVSDRPMDVDLARAMCIGDRRLLMIELARLAMGNTFWVHPRCVGCGAQFDVRVDRRELPKKPRAEIYPEIVVDLDGRCIRLRLPSGGDQEDLAGMNACDARAFLLRRCVSELDGHVPDGPWFCGLALSEVATIEEALEKAAPDVGTTMEVECPECGELQRSEFNPYDWQPTQEPLWEEVHVLAATYHWSEGEILDLPRSKRQRYLRLIERSQGVSA
ncbi:MAG: hypothetical protein RIT81_47115 [Deltaproteobacteria bacterium]